MDQKCPIGWMVKKGQNHVHVAIECPLLFRIVSIAQSLILSKNNRAENFLIFPKMSDFQICFFCLLLDKLVVFVRVFLLNTFLLNAFNAVWLSAELLFYTSFV